jgi:hypothetical protein
MTTSMRARRLCWRDLFTFRRSYPLTTQFKIGDRVRWNSEAGHLSGRIIKVHRKDTDYKGYTHHASADDPQYEIRSGKSDHVAMHKGGALHKID